MDDRIRRLEYRVETLEYWVAEISRHLKEKATEPERKPNDLTPVGVPEWVEDWSGVAG